MIVYCTCVCLGGTGVELGGTGSFGKKLELALGSGFWFPGAFCWSDSGIHYSTRSHLLTLFCCSGVCVLGVIHFCPLFAAMVVQLLHIRIPVSVLWCGKTGSV